MVIISKERKIMQINYILIIITCCFIVFDIISGFVQAVANKEVNSTTMKQGLWHKCGFLLAICFGILCELAMLYADLGFTIPILNAVCMFINATELVSILENLAKLSPELANTKFMDIFRRDE